MKRSGVLLFTLLLVMVAISTNANAAIMPQSTAQAATATQSPPASAMDNFALAPQIQVNPQNGNRPDLDVGFAPATMKQGQMTGTQMKHALSWRTQFNL